MKPTRTSVLSAALLAAFVLHAAPRACAADDQPRSEADVDDQSWYYTQGSPAKVKPIKQQKAEARAAARMARLDSSRWYGFQHARPTATGIPFTTMYSPAWQMPGGRPFAWYTGYHTPVVIIR